MIPENPPTQKYWYAPYDEGYESRSQRRLKNDLGIDEATAESIIHLRRQVLELQSYIRQLESELSAEMDSQQFRLARSRQVYFEATWIELEIQDSGS